MVMVWFFVFLFFFPRIMSTGNLFVYDRMQALFPVLFCLASLWQTYLFISFIISGYIKRVMQLSWSIYIWASKAKFLFKTWKKKKTIRKRKKQNQCWTWGFWGQRIKWHVKLILFSKLWLEDNLLWLAGPHMCILSSLILRTAKSMIKLTVNCIQHH